MIVKLILYLGLFLWENPNQKQNLGCFELIPKLDFECSQKDSVITSVKQFFAWKYEDGHVYASFQQCCCQTIEICSFCHNESPVFSSNGVVSRVVRALMTQWKSEVGVISMTELEWEESEYSIFFQLCLWLRCLWSSENKISRVRRRSGRIDQSKGTFSCFVIGNSSSASAGDSDNLVFTRS